MSFMEYDSPIMTGVNKIVDILLLSCLWFVCWRKNRSCLEREEECVQGRNRVSVEWYCRN